MELWIALGAMAVVLATVGYWVSRALAHERRRRGRVTDAEWDALVDTISVETMLTRAGAERWVQWFRGTDVPRSFLPSLPRYASLGIEASHLVQAMSPTITRRALDRRFGVGRIRKW